MSQVFVNIIGHNSSGKTTLAKKLETDLILGYDQHNYAAIKDVLEKIVV